VTDSNFKHSPLAVSSNKAKGGSPSKTGIPGVTFDKRNGRWQTSVMLANGKRKFVGRGDTPEAALALRVAFIARHGTAAPVKAATATTGEVQQ
jgi:hypothetical protein